MPACVRPRSSRRENDVQHRSRALATAATRVGMLLASIATSSVRSFRSIETVRVALAAALWLSSFSCGGKPTKSSPWNSGANSDVPNVDRTDATAPTTNSTPEKSSSSAAPGGNAGMPDGEAGAPDGAAGTPHGDAGTPDAEAGTPPAVTPTNTKPPFACANPTPLVFEGQDTGYDTCQGGTLRRRAIVACPDPPPDGSTGCPAPEAGVSLPYMPTCAVNSDCTERAHGACVNPYDSFVTQSLMYQGCTCVYGCARDSDCQAGQICLCGGESIEGWSPQPVGKCVPASCNAGTCPAGFECADSKCPAGVGTQRFDCQTPSDACLSDLDCQAQADSGVQPNVPLTCSVPPGMPESARACLDARAGGACGLM